MPAAVAEVCSRASLARSCVPSQYQMELGPGDGGSTGVRAVPSRRGQNSGVQGGVKTEAHAMSLIRDRVTVSRCWGAVLFSALLALPLFNPSVATAQEM